MKFLKNFKKHFKRINNTPITFSLTSDQLYDIKSCFYDISDLYSVEIVSDYGLDSIKFDKIPNRELKDLEIVIHNFFAYGTQLDVNKVIDYNEIKDSLFFSVSYIESEMNLKLTEVSIVSINDDNVFESRYLKELPESYDRSIYNIRLCFKRF